MELCFLMNIILRNYMTSHNFSEIYGYMYLSANSHFKIVLLLNRFIDCLYQSEKGIREWRIWMFVHVSIPHIRVCLSVEVLCSKTKLIFGTLTVEVMSHSAGIPIPITLCNFTARWITRSFQSKLIKEWMYKSSSIIVFKIFLSAVLTSITAY